MGITSQRSNFHHHLTALLRWFMSQPPPTYIQGLFASSDCMVDTRTWHQLLRDDASSCKLTCLEFYKTRVAKLHEFLVLYFSHPTHTGARAVVVVDRTLKDRSQSSAVVSPSIPPQKATDAHDRVYVMAQGENLDTYLSRTYGKYDKLCTLRYPSAESDPPSAVRVSTLLLVATNHQPNYNLYEYNCYWYADIIFEACKDLFPMCQEECHKHGDRGRSRLNIPMLAKHSLRDICDEYHHEWNKVMQRRKTNQEIIAQQVGISCGYGSQLVTWAFTQQELEQRFEAAQQVGYIRVVVHS